MSAAFIQMMNGRLDVTDSSFDRLRARGNNVNMVFEHNRARQIEVTTVSGSIVYDNGTFDPDSRGLNRPTARSDRRRHGRTGCGALDRGTRLFDVDKRTPIDQRSTGEASATIAGGGPVVNAVTVRGNVYLYDGAFSSRHTIPPEWQPVREALQGPDFRHEAPDAFRRYRALRGRTI